MKYLREDMSQEEARKAYRKFAKTLHPDVGGNEQEFQILANEYAAISRRGMQDVAESYESIMQRTEKVIQLLLNTLYELYPRTPVHISYSAISAELEVPDNTPLQKMVHIAQIAQDVPLKWRVTVFFGMPGVKRKYTLRIVRDTVYINVGMNDTPNVTDGKVIHKGSRYCIEQGTQYEFCKDQKTGLRYYLRRTPKLKLKELLRL